jgi:hypothetical protein
MRREISGGLVYPDHVQKELSTNTHWVALYRFEALVNNFRKAGRPVPDEYLQRIEGMYDYLAYSLRSDGHQPLNNDSDRQNLRPEGLHGLSLRDQLEDPHTPSKKAAYAHWTRAQATVRNEDWRLIVHRPGDEIEGFELFDFREKSEGERRYPDDIPCFRNQLPFVDENRFFAC